MSPLPVISDSIEEDNFRHHPTYISSPIFPVNKQKSLKLSNASALTATISPSKKKKSGSILELQECLPMSVA